MLAFHITRLDKDSLARKVYDEQVENSWPDLAKEVEKICQDLSVENVNVTKLSSKIYRAKVLKAQARAREDFFKFHASGN